jgi:Sulfotransferase family
MISHQHGCIFVHIPRCGGTSIEDVIWPPPRQRTVADLWAGYNGNPYQTGGLQHLCANHIRREVGAAFDSYWKFAFVRNPWDRVISQYLFTLRQRQDLRDILGIPADASLELYLSRVLDREHVQWLQQRPFLYDGETLLVDFVGRFEQFVDDAHRVFQRLGVTEPLPHEQKSERTHDHDYYNPTTRDMVARIYAEDIETFGYDF